MSTILIGSVPIHGHVTPLLAVARHLVDAGHQVRFLTGARFADAVTASGAKHIALPPEADFDDRDIAGSFPERANYSGTRALAFDIEAIFLKPAKAQYLAVMAELRTPTDAVIVDPAFAGGAIVVGHPLGERPPVIIAGVLPLGLPARGLAPYGLGLAPMGGPIGAVRNAALTVLANKVLFGAANKRASEVYRSVHGRPFPGPVLNWGTTADAIVQFSVSGFEYPRPGYEELLSFVGPITSSASAQVSLPDWFDDLDGSVPVVHVTQGTIANDDFGQLVGPTLTALADKPVLVVVATGGVPLSSLPELPANARAAEYLPYDALLSRTDVFVTNGGYGGVHYALRHGLPIVVAGANEDKPEVAARIGWSGVGIDLHTGTPTPAKVGAAVEQLLSDSRYRVASERVREQIAAAPGISGLIQVLDRLTGTPVR